MNRQTPVTGSDLRTAYPVGGVIRVGGLIRSPDSFTIKEVKK